ncbi:hypothetical protein Moror_5728 [Moniliophthora roreri MCA 2997]|uniref:Uncharacterized protein n=1 Tax=Moniliophthora roreri (strain MCA 2997) TaxID=1381753 RepID=V2Y6L6_MONRO|nr:hypothetical protein Moror_5728 [Moniliophthora roreri MCA 2997]
MFSYHVEVIRQLGGPGIPISVTFLWSTDGPREHPIDLGFHRLRTVYWHRLHPSSTYCSPFSKRPPKSSLALLVHRRDAALCFILHIILLRATVQRTSGSRALPGSSFPRILWDCICFWHDTVTQSSTPHPEGYILIPLLLYWRILSACSGDDDAAAASRRARSPWLLVGLIALWILLTLVYVMIGVNSPDNGVTERTETSVYCYFRSPLLRVSVRGVCAILILPGVFILVLIVRSVIRARNTPIAQKYTSTVIKLIVMLIISFIALIVAFTTPSNQQVDLVINTTGHAFLPAVAMMLFASQRDFFSAWKEAAKSLVF